MHTYYIGIPIPIVAISAGISHDQYGNDELYAIRFYVFICLYSTFSVKYVVAG